jgi:hypothetical protein
MKKVLFIILFCSFQSCVFETAGLRVKFVNISKNSVVVGELSYPVGDDCDSCSIMNDVRFYCRSQDYAGGYPILLKSKDSIDVQWKLFTYQKIYVINADSLTEYCNKGYSYNITQKKWVQVLKEKVDLENKTCRFVIR